MEEVMEFRDTMKIIARAASRRETVEIYYPRTESTPRGWREVEPYSITTDIPPHGEHLVYGKDIISPGHILNARPMESKEIRSFVLGKIRGARRTGRWFTANNDWKVEF